MNSTEDNVDTVVYNGEGMPLCRRDDLLEFTQTCGLETTLLNGMTLFKVEESGSTYDGATIPKLFWRIIGKPLSKEFRWPSYWHDRLCQQHPTWAERRLADAALLVLLERENVSYWRRTAMWIAVRFYAWFIWKPSVKKAKSP